MAYTISLALLGKLGQEDFVNAEKASNNYPLLSMANDGYVLFGGWFLKKNLTSFDAWRELFTKVFWSQIWHLVHVH